MIKNFSDSVRRNQKQWMVVITILAVFSFVFDDLIRGAGKMSGEVVFVAVFVGAGMSIIGYRRGKTTEFGLAGVAVGVLVGLVWLRSMGPPVVVRTKDGSYTQADINLLRSDRHRVERFLGIIAKKIDKKGFIPGFGQQDVGSMVSFAVLHKEARRMGVVVTDESVNQYLSRVTEDKLSEKDYNTALLEAGLSEGELFNIVRGELEVQLVGNLISAPAESGQYFNRSSGRIERARIARQTPEELWQSFRKLHVRQALTSVAVPVGDFVTLVPEPTESELRVFFDNHKKSYGNDQGTPGFLEPPKVRLAYLAVANLEAYEKQVPEITDEDVVNYYLTHKDSFRINEIPSPSGPLLPDFMHDPISGDSTPADATQVENAGDGKAEGKSEESSADTKNDAKPATPEKPAAPDKPDAAPDKKEPPCGDDAKADKTAADKKDETAAAEAAKSVDPPAKTDDKSPPAPALPTNEPADASAPSSGTDSATPALNSLPQPPAAPRYRELNDELKLDISAIILHEKAFLKMGETADQALETMMVLSLKYAEVKPKDREAEAKSFAAKLKSYAEENGLEYNETKEMSQFDLMNPTNDPIGGATETVAGASVSRMQISVAEEVFMRDNLGRGYRLPAFSPRRADTRKARYAYWKIQEIEERAPDLKDVRQKVVDAYKFEKARPLAADRAKKLADLMKDKESNIAAALSGQTINGTADSPAVTIRESGRFSWLHLPQSLPQFTVDPPVQSTIDGIGQPGFQFMKTVFDELENDGTGVALNSSRTTYFAVRVHDRDGSGAEGSEVASLESLQAQFAREKFSSFFLTPYEFIGYEIQRVVDSRWQDNFRKRYGIKFENEMASSTGDE